MPAARARLWCLTGALLPAALIVWLRSAAVLDFGCETWQHETCGIFFRCARCVHVLQNLYWLARARLYSSPGCGVLVGVLVGIVLVASSCAQRTLAAECRQRASKSPSTVRRWMATVFSVALLLAVCIQPTQMPRRPRGHAIVSVVKLAVNTLLLQA